MISSLFFLLIYKLCYTLELLAFFFFFLTMERFGFSDRLAMGDPDFVSEQQVVQQQMLDKDHASVLRQRLNKVWLIEKQTERRGEDLYVVIIFNSFFSHGPILQHITST